jgi:uncharacterized protein YbjT (DUF2867 family)
MKIVVVGGTGRIGKRLVRKLQSMDVDVITAARSVGVDIVKGVGLRDALSGADVLVDVSNSPSLDGDAALAFFDTAGRNLAAAARDAGVRQFIALSIVGVDRLQNQEYFQAKRRQEELVRASGLPFTILRSTQFFEFICAVVQTGTKSEIAISPALTQPVAGADVAAALEELALGRPVNGTIELAGPEQFSLDYVATEIATALEDGRWIVADAHARYFGAELQERSLLPGPLARTGALRLNDWIRDYLLAPAPTAEAALEW